MNLSWHFSSENHHRHHYLCNGKVKWNYRKAIWLRDSQRWVQAANEVGHLVEGDELRCVGVEPGQIIRMKYYWFQIRRNWCNKCCLRGKSSEASQSSPPHLWDYFRRLWNCDGQCGCDLEHFWNWTFHLFHCVSLAKRAQMVMMRNSLGPLAIEHLKVLFHDANLLLL